MTPDDRRQARLHTQQHPDTLLARTYTELLYIEELLDLVTRYHPKFDDYRKAIAWKHKYGDTE